MRRLPLPRGRTVQLAGFSVIELMVSMAIGLLVILAIFQILVASESRKRITMALNDANQNGVHVGVLLDRAVRSAGSGLAAEAKDVYGCPLSATRSGVALSGAPLAAPFANASLTPILAPVIVDRGLSLNGSDLITVMAGNAGFGEAAQRVLPNPGVTDRVRLRNTIGFRIHDLVLIGGPGSNCVVTQVASDPLNNGADQNLMLGGEYYAAAPLASLVTGGQFVLNLGNVPPIGTPSVNPPDFVMYGVDDAHTLYRTDLLDASSGGPIAEGVFRMHVLYGIDTTGGASGNRVVNAWVAPTGAWSGAALRSGTPSARANLRNILALRIALVMRNQSPEINTAASTPDAVADNAVTLFADQPASTLTIPITERNYRYRVIDMTVPLRNNLMP